MILPAHAADFLQRLEALMERATVRPWAVDPDDRPDMEWNNHIVEVGTVNTICFMAHDPKDNSGQEAAAELIALLANHAPAIAQVVRALESLAEVYDAMGAPRGPSRILAEAALAALNAEGK